MVEPAAHRHTTTFETQIPLQALLDGPELPGVLRRALTRTISREQRQLLTIGESLRRWQTPILREWITGLLAHDIGIEFIDTNGERTWNHISTLFAEQRLDQVSISAIDIPMLAQNEAFGAAYIARAPGDVAIVNAAAFLILDASQRVQSSFVYVSGASQQPIMPINLWTLRDNPLDEANIGSAVKVVAPQVDPVGDDLASADDRRELAREVVQNALLECLEQRS